MVVVVVVAEKKEARRVEEQYSRMGMGPQLTRVILVREPLGTYVNLPKMTNGAMNLAVSARHHFRFPNPVARSDQILSWTTMDNRCSADGSTSTQFASQHFTEGTVGCCVNGSTMCSCSFVEVLSVEHSYASFVLTPGMGSHPVPGRK